VTNTNVEEGVFVKKDELLSDLSKVYQEGLYHDITIGFPDNVRVSTNKFMLVCRIPYFSTLLSSDFTDKSSELSLEVNACSSEIFKKILDFVWTGELHLSGLHLNSILALLETARFLCIDLLVDCIEVYIKYLSTLKKIDLVSSLNALDFSISHKFPKISNIILGFVALNIEEISSLPEFRQLSKDSMMMLLSMKEGRVSSEISLFKALLKWLEGNQKISEVTKEEMAKSFDLDNFSNSDLEMLEKSNLFSERRLLHLTLSRNHDLEEVIRALLPTSFKLTLDRYEGDRISVWKMDICSIISCIEFNLRNKCHHETRYSIEVGASTDGVIWSSIVNKVVYFGAQIVAFRRRRMQFVRITLENRTGLCNRNTCLVTIDKSDVSNVQTALM